MVSDSGGRTSKTCFDSSGSKFAGTQAFLGLNFITKLQAAVKSSKFDLREEEIQMVQMLFIFVVL